MKTVFIAGSISISRLHEKVRERINNIVSQDLNVVVGDADGADTSIQECLQAYHASKVTVYCTGEAPRNNVADWPVHHVQSQARAGTRAFFTAKDVEMAKNSDFGLMVWDCKSTGTLSNVIELLKAKKKSVVFVNKNKDFVTIGDKSGLDHLLHFMSEHARAKAEEKIGLSTKITALSQESFTLDAPATEAPKDLLDAAADPTVTETVASTAETESVKLRAVLMSALADHIARTHLSQSQAAKVFGVTQPRVSDLLRGKTNLFGLDTLINMAAAAGLRVEMRVLESA
ncbi:helix-turn-helix domain-containing protein [Xanthomonas cassavae CFBP 4642]|uniref:Helix-turn-helix domain-containing protein n=1 Tax=Xanthomonas cassavae CFBP 4642 TaxID=1219375 RepID=A0ABS8HDR2_9XANT|nr:helix-turn-helix transcriptional regulator [Xanthomonas cassavae]MCC4620294.1 helix-turn-helix domain-containing protein [Xanthomonas cassavae CFBP 4642]